MTGWEESETRWRRGAGKIDQKSSQSGGSAWGSRQGKKNTFNGYPPPPPPPHRRQMTFGLTEVGRKNYWSRWKNPISHDRYGEQKKDPPQSLKPLFCASNCQEKKKGFFSTAKGKSEGRRSQVKGRRQWLGSATPPSFVIYQLVIDSRPLFIQRSIQCLEKKG